MTVGVLVLEGGSLRITRTDAALLRAGRMPEQMFFEAVLARVEVNRNRDEITADHLREIAPSIAHTPIDDDHKQGVVWGHIIAARYDDGQKALIASCVTFPRRFPDVALGLLGGTLKFSIESAADAVSCSTCGARFATTVPEDGYCACLQARRTSAGGATRRWHANRGIGAAFTKDPAGTDCALTEGTITLVASYDEAASPDDVAGLLTASVFLDAGTMTPPTKLEAKESMDPEKLAARITRMIAAAKAGQTAMDDGDEDDSEDGKKAKAMCSVLRPLLADLVAHVSTAAATAKETELSAAHQTALQAAIAKGESDLLAERRVNQLKSLGVEKADEQRGLLASMTEEVWGFALAGYQKPAPSPVAPATPPPAPTAPAAPTPPADATTLTAHAAQGAAITPTSATGAGTPGRTPFKLGEDTFVRTPAKHA